MLAGDYKGRGTEVLTPERITTDGQCTLIRSLSRLVEACSQNEVELCSRRAANDQDLKETYAGQREQVIAQFETEYQKVQAEFRRAREAVESKFASEGYELAQQERKSVEDLAKEHAVVLENVKQDWELARKQMLDALESHKDSPKNEFLRFKQQWDQYCYDLTVLEKRAGQIVRRRGCLIPETVPDAAIPPTGRWKGEYLQGCAEVLAVASQRLRQLRNQPAARLNEVGMPLLLALFAALGAAYPAWRLLGDYGYAWTTAAAAVGVCLAFIVRQICRWLGRRQTHAAFTLFQQAVIETKAALTAALQQAKVDTERKRNELREEHEDRVNEAHLSWSQTRNRLKADYDAKVKQTSERFDACRRTITQTHDLQLDVLNQKYPPQIKKLEQEFEAQLLQLSETFRQQLACVRQQFEQNWDSLVHRWTAGISDFQQVVVQMNQACDARSPEWSQIDWPNWQPSADQLTSLRFGRYTVNLAALANGLPNGEELQVSQVDFSLPAVLAFPECPSLLLEAEGDGRAAAIESLQNVMLRLLTSLPAGKVRFTIIDPIGLGQNFSAFMHLADYDERLVTSRIWTEAAHINQRLADLTEHMENVIQKYLRNEFASIQEYNRQAGEVAEPFQILVVANFPANFSEEATRRLVSVASSGARCGVYTLISSDMKMKLPKNFDLADLEACAATLVWQEGRFCWKQEDLQALPLVLDAPPEHDRFTMAVRAVGRLAKESSRVEVPFEMVVPDEGHWWSCDSRGGLEVPLGRAGATKLQSLRLGKGTSQHVLISGKTGSGKSTLLHALITNLSLHYSPDEVQFYLVDFKKGVEFKPYATYHLPHARVIAIESEREFGMSVLERLDLELRRRGDLFRAAGVQDIQGYRQANPEALMPRILLIIDEFQELFVSDDKIAQDASLLLDRLVRQGRAFGMHVLLGSQTLSGAYTLARSTIGQMAVRIALQCSETDAHLILSEDNTAARLLHRPGEAIYNDANGLFEGNHPFQVVWLPDSTRESYLQRIGQLVQQRKVAVEPLIVFEGNVAADPSENRSLRHLIEGVTSAGETAVPRAWLGAAVAIKEPTCVHFRRQTGSNLLLVGQQEAMAMGVLANCLISLGAQRRASERTGGQGPRAGHGPSPLHPFYVLDGTPSEAPDAGFWDRFARALPLELQVVSPRNVTDTISLIGNEVERRLQANEFSAEPIFLVVYNLARLRDLKKSDEFGFTSLDDTSPPSVDKLFTTIVREGPTLGVHLLIWCDSYNNVNRWLDRQILNDLDMRVLFQMSATDSSNLMDSPAASRLGGHRALLYSQEHGQAEKFRPYGVPSREWLAWVRKQMERRSVSVPLA